MKPKILIATHNQGKLQEYQQVAVEYGVLVAGLPDISTPPQETGTSYLANALEKAEYYFRAQRLPILCDDGGLSLAAFPEILGVETQRFFKSRDPHQQNLELLALYQDQPNASRSVTLTASLVYYWGPQKYLAVEKELVGELVAPIGRGGYGFDEIFYLPQRKKTLAELTAQERNAYSPRLKAFRQLLQELKEGKILV